VVPGQPLSSDPTPLEEYVWLYTNPEAEVHTRSLRAWVREADRTIRANNEVYGFKPDAEEDLPWLTRVWHSFLRLFTEA